MSIESLNKYFREFNRLAKGDAFINSDQDKNDYERVISSHPNKNEAAKDGRIDFWEYMEATAPAEIKGRARETVIFFSQNSTFDRTRDPEALLAIFKDLQGKDHLTKEETEFRFKVIERMVAAAWTYNEKRHGIAIKALVGALAMLRSDEKDMASLIMHALLVNLKFVDKYEHSERIRSINMLFEAYKLIGPELPDLRVEIINEIFHELDDFGEKVRKAVSDVIYELYINSGTGERKEKTAVFDSLERWLNSSSAPTCQRELSSIMEKLVGIVDTETEANRRRIFDLLTTASTKISINVRVRISDGMSNEDIAQRKKVIDGKINELRGTNEYVSKFAATVLGNIYVSLSPDDDNLRAMIVSEIIQKIPNNGYDIWGYYNNALLVIFKATTNNERRIRRQIFDVIARQVKQASWLGHYLTEIYASLSDDEHAMRKEVIDLLMVAANYRELAAICVAKNTKKEERESIVELIMSNIAKDGGSNISYLGTIYGGLGTDEGPLKERILKRIFEGLEGDPESSDYTGYLAALYEIFKQGVPLNDDLMYRAVTVMIRDIKKQREKEYYDRGKCEFNGKILCAIYPLVKNDGIKGQITEVLLAGGKNKMGWNISMSIEILAIFYEAVGKEDERTRSSIIEKIISTDGIVASYDSAKALRDMLKICMPTDKALMQKLVNYATRSVLYGDFSVNDWAIDILGDIVEGIVSCDVETRNRTIAMLIKAHSRTLSDYQCCRSSHTRSVLCDIYVNLSEDEKAKNWRIIEAIRSGIDDKSSNSDVPDLIGKIFLSTPPENVLMRRRMFRMILELGGRTSSWSGQPSIRPLCCIYTNSGEGDQDVRDTIIDILFGAYCQKSDAVCYDDGMLARNFVRYVLRYNKENNKSLWERYIDIAIRNIRTGKYASHNINVLADVYEGLMPQEGQMKRKIVDAVCQCVRSRDWLDVVRSIEVLGRIFSYLDLAESDMKKQIIVTVLSGLGSKDHNKRYYASGMIQQIMKNIVEKEAELTRIIISNLLTMLNDNDDGVRKSALSLLLEAYKRLDKNDLEMKREVIRAVCQKLYDGALMIEAFDVAEKMLRDPITDDQALKDMILERIFEAAKSENDRARSRAVNSLGNIYLTLSENNAILKMRIFSLILEGTTDTYGEVRIDCNNQVMHIYKDSNQGILRGRIVERIKSNLNHKDEKVRGEALERMADIYNNCGEDEQELRAYALDIIFSTIDMERSGRYVDLSALDKLLVDLDRSSFDFMLTRMRRKRGVENIRLSSYVFARLVTLSKAKYKDEASNILIDALEDDGAKDVAGRLIDLIGDSSVEEPTKKKFIEALWRAFRSTGNAELKAYLSSILCRSDLMARLEKPERQKALLNHGVSSLSESGDLEVLKGLNDNLGSILKEKDIPLETKLFILDKYLAFIIDPTSFKFYSIKYDDNNFDALMIRAQLATAICENLVGALSGISDARTVNGMMRKVLEKAQAYLKSEDRNLKDVGYLLIAKAYKVFVYDRSDNVPILDTASIDTIEKLYARPSGPSSYIYSDGKIKVKIFFQEFVKECIWIEAYLNEAHGYKVASYTLARVPENFSVEDLRAMRFSGNSSGSGLLFRMLEDPIKIKRLRDFIVENSGKKIDVQSLPGDQRDILRALLSIGLVEQRVFVKLGTKEVAYVDGNGQQHEGLLTVEVIVPRAPYNYHNFKAYLFNDLTEGSDIDYIIYNGHAGMSHTLAASFKAAKAYFREAIIQLSNCWSQSHLPDIQQKFRYAHPILTKGGGWSRDGCIIFGSMMENMLTNGTATTYDMVRSSIKKNEFSIGGQKVREISQDNYFFISDEYFLQKSDVDGDGIPDIKDNEYTFNIVASFEDNYDVTFRPASTLQARVAPDYKADVAVGDINRYFEDDGLFLKKYKCELDRETNTTHKGWYSPETDTNEGVSVRRGYWEDVSYFAKLNIGYANCGLPALRVISLFETAMHISNERRSETLEAKKYLEKNYYDGLLATAEDINKERDIEAKAHEKLGLTKADIDKAYSILGIANDKDKQLTLVNVARAFLIAAQSIEKLYIQAGTTADERDSLIRLYNSFISTYNLPNVDFKECLKILDIAENIPIMWYIAYIAKNGIKLPENMGKRSTERG